MFLGINANPAVIEFLPVPLDRFRTVGLGPEGPKPLVLDLPHPSQLKSVADSFALVGRVDR